jgi:hypothetical protein
VCVFSLCGLSCWVAWDCLDGEFSTTGYDADRGALLGEKRLFLRGGLHISVFARQRRKVCFLHILFRQQPSTMYLLAHCGNSVGVVVVRWVWGSLGLSELGDLGVCVMLWFPLMGSGSAGIVDCQTWFWLAFLSMLRKSMH